MSRHDEAMTFLQSWDPEVGELPAWIADRLDDDDELRAAFDARFPPWDAGDLGGRNELPAQRRPRLGRALLGGLALAATALLVLGGVGTTLFATLDSAEPRARSAAAPMALDAADVDEAAPPPPSLDAADVDAAAPPPPPLGPPVQPGELDSETRDALMAIGYLLDDPAPATGAPVSAPRPHGFVQTADDPRSTFSVDVDTASFTMARRSLRDGRRPDPGSVRVEEFVNFPPYGYPPPGGDAPFAVHVQGAPSPFDGTELVRVGIQGARVGDDARKSAHLTFLVDTSGSMQSPDKIGYVQHALTALTEQLREGDTVAIVAYAGTAGVVLGPTPMRRRDRILGAIERLRAGGSTAMGKGIVSAYALAEQTFVAGHVNRVVLLSDGDANVGITDPDALVATIRQYADRGITLTTVGLGVGNYRDAMMERLADKGDGNYVYVDSEREARRVFVDRLTSTLEVIARDVKIQVEWSPDLVERYRLVGYDNRRIADRDFRDDTVDAGEVGAGHQVTAIYQIERTPAGRRAPPGAWLATVRIRSEPPGGQGEAVERVTPVTAGVLQRSFADADRDLRLAVGAAWLAEVLRGSPYRGEATMYGVLDVINRAVDPDVAEHRDVLEVARLATLQQ